MEIPYERAEWVESALADKSLRPLKKAWCPKCSRMLAAIVYLDGRRQLFLAGGRAASHGEMMAEWGRTRTDFEYDLRQAVAAGDGVTAQRAREALEWLDEVTEEWRAKRLPGLAPPRLFDLAAGEYTAACSGCRRERRVRVTDDGDLGVA